MIPILTLLGFKNVGKTTIFNILSKYNKFFINYNLKSKIKNYSICDINNYLFLLVDTPGFFNYINIEYKLNLYLLNSDIVLFIIDFNFNSNYINFIISNYLRKSKKYIFLIINKFDNNKFYININNFNFNLGKPFLVSALHNFNLNKTINNILSIYCFNKNCLKKIKLKNYSVIILGKFDTGKNTFIFSLLKNKNIFILKSLLFYLKYKKIYFNFIKFFSFLNKKNINTNIFKKLVLFNLILYFISPVNSLNNIDFKIYSLVLNNYLNIIFIINKSDLLNLYEKKFYKNFFKKKLRVKNFYILFISSLFSKNLIYIKNFIKKIYFYSFININTNKLNKIITNFYKFLKIYYKYIIRVKYVHQGGKNPILIIIHRKKSNKLSNCYKNFLEKIFIKKLKIKGIPLKIKF